MLAATWPEFVDLSRLPAEGKLKNTEYGIVDGDTFDRSPTPDHTLREKQDPRYHTNIQWGKEQVDQAVREVVEDIRREWLLAP